MTSDAVEDAGKKKSNAVDASVGLDLKWFRFSFDGCRRIGLIPTGTSTTCGILAFLFRHCQSARDGSYVYLRSEGGEWRYTRKQGL